jgi:signal-transduction protein with cAMP-binding, CBS, and nucleotidyltransferase domain
MRTPVSIILRNQGKTVTAHRDLTVLDAVRTMSERNVGSILIVDEKDELLGIFTERDLLKRVTAASLDPGDTTISEVMTSDVIVVGRDADRQTVHSIMREKHVRHIPVLDGRRVLGVISLRDVLRSENEEKSFELDQLKRYVTEKPYPSYPA